MQGIQPRFSEFCTERHPCYAIGGRPKIVLTGAIGAEAGGGSRNAALYPGARPGEGFLVASQVFGFRAAGLMEGMAHISVGIYNSYEPSEDKGRQKERRRTSMDGMGNPGSTRPFSPNRSKEPE